MPYIDSQSALNWDHLRKFMEHSYIDEHYVADRYLLGKLSPEERVRFEEHVADCMQCLDRLETTEDFRAGLRIVVAREALLQRADLQTGRAGLLASLVRLSRARLAALLVGATLLIGLPLAAMIMERSARRDLAQATQALSEWQRKYEKGERSALDLIKELQEHERQSSELRQQLAAQLEREKEERMRLANEVNKAISPQVVVPVFDLSFERSADPDLSQPVNRIMLSRSSKLFILLLELTPNPELLYYRASISTSDGRNIWRESDLKPNSDDTLALSFNSSLFKPGAYLLTLERLTAQKRSAPIAKYTFRLLTR
jgi:hypothetical protein